MSYANDDIRELEHERDVYREFWEAMTSWEKSSSPSSPNEEYLPAAERFSKAREAVKRMRGEV